MNEKLIEKLFDTALALANEKGFPPSEAIAEPSELRGVESALVAGQSTQYEYSQNHSVESVWVIGQAYWVQAATITLTGRLTTVTEQELVFDEGAWMSDMGKFSECLRDGTPEKVQPFHAPVILIRSSIVIAVPWNHKLPH